MPTNTYFVQSTNSRNLTFGFVRPVTKGNCILLLSAAVTGDITSLTDTQGNVWEIESSVNAGSPSFVRMTVWSTIAKRSGPLAITIVTVASNRAFALHEYKDILCVDRGRRLLEDHNQATNTGTAISSGTVSWPTGTRLLVGVWGRGGTGTASTPGTGFVARETRTDGLSTQGAVYTEDGVFSVPTAATFTAGTSIVWACIGIALEPKLKPRVNQWQFNLLRAFNPDSGVDPADGDWSDTLTWTGTFVAEEVEAFTADTLTWTDTFTPTEVDEVPQTDTLTWSDTFDLSGADVELEDTVTWDDDLDFSTSEASWEDELEWDDDAIAVGLDVAMSDTLTWTPDLDIGIEAELADPLTWYELYRVIEDGDMPDDVVTWEDEFVGLPELETLVTDLLLWEDELDNDFQVGDTVFWLDAFFYEGEVFPDVEVSWEDTLTWDMQSIDTNTQYDALTWTDQFTLPIQTQNEGETLFWSDAFSPDVNLLAFARYRR